MQTVLSVRDRTLPGLTEPAFDHHTQGSVPIELRHYLRRGLALDKADRFEDTAEAITQFERVRAGDFAVQCPITLMKAGHTRMGRFMDRHPMASVGVALGSGLTVVMGLAGWVAAAVS